MDDYPSFKLISPTRKEPTHEEQALSPHATQLPLTVMNETDLGIINLMTKVELLKQIENTLPRKIEHQEHIIDELTTTLQERPPDAKSEESEDQLDRNAAIAEFIENIEPTCPIIIIYYLQLYPM
ncbi:hypothetical protein ACP275_14G134100 [Erythranthe tilingii]